MHQMLPLASKIAGVVPDHLFPLKCLYSWPDLFIYFAIGGNPDKIPCNSSVVVQFWAYNL